MNATSNDDILVAIGVKTAQFRIQHRIAHFLTQIQMADSILLDAIQSYILDKFKISVDQNYLFFVIQKNLGLLVVKLQALVGFSLSWKVCELKFFIV